MPSMNLTRASIIVLATVIPSLARQPQAIAAPQNQTFTLKFAARVGQKPFNCNSSYPLDKSAIKYRASDFRFYISDVALIDRTGKAVPVTLEQDGKWQYENVALLDFENRTGACANGTIETRDRIVGKLPPGDYTGLKFSLGIPSNLNHEDGTLAASPLNLTSLWWNWRSGYKFLRIDLEANAAKPHSNRNHKQHSHRETKSSGFPIHLGSTGCKEESSTDPKNCTYPNRTTVLLSNFNPTKHMVVADLKQLVAGSNLSQNHPQTSPGCMSEPNDKDCAGIMKNLGLPFADKPSSSQKFFRLANSTSQMPK
jgi:uncharacterized repeat protein (TIGR04052 family)